MTKKIKSVFVYSLSVILFLGYLFVFVSGLIQRNVSEEYEMYYVKHTLKDWPGYGGLSYTLGTVEYFGESGNIIKRRGSGWGDIEEDGCCVIGKRAFLYYRNLSTKMLELQIITDGSDFQKTVNVFADDQKIGSIDCTENNTVYIFSILPDMIKDGALNLSFVPENYKGEQSYVKICNVTLR